MNEREIERKLRHIVTEELQKGSKATAKYQKLVMNNKIQVQLEGIMQKAK